MRRFYKKADAFLKKSGAKNFYSSGPLAAKHPGSKLTKVFGSFFQKRTAFLNLPKRHQQPARNNQRAAAINRQARTHAKRKTINNLRHHEKQCHIHAEQFSEIPGRQI